MIKIIKGVKISPPKGGEKVIMSIYVSKRNESKVQFLETARKLSELKARLELNPEENKKWKVVQF